MSKDPGQNLDPASTLPMSNEKPNIISPPPLPGEVAYFEYSSAHNPGQTSAGYRYPPPSYPPHYFYPPPAYIHHNRPGGQPYPVYVYPLPLGTAIKQLPKQYLKILTKPSVATFAQEKQKAAWNIIWVQLAFIGIIGAFISFVNDAVLLPTIFSYLHISKIGTIDVTSIYKGQALSNGFSALFGTPVGLLIAWTLLYFIARGFKGRGTFIEFIYCYTLIYVPFQIIDGLLVLMPLAADLLLGIPIAIYAAILTIFMTRAVHHLSTRNAILAVFIAPFSLLVLLVIGVVLSFLILLPFISKGL